MISLYDRLKARRTLGIHALAMYNNGMTQTQIAKHFGVSTSHISNVLRANPNYDPDLAKRRRKPKKTRYTHAQQRMDRSRRADVLAIDHIKGWSMKQLAQREGISHQRIYALLRYSKHFAAIERKRELNKGIDDGGPPRLVQQRMARARRADVLAKDYINGWSGTELAEREGISHQRIYFLLRYSKHFAEIERKRAWRKGE